MASPYDEYKKNGFYVAKGQIDPQIIRSTLDSLNKSVAAQITACGGAECGDDIFDNLKTLFRSDLDRYKKLVGALWRKEAVFALMHNKRIIEFLREEFGWDDLFVPGGQVVHIMAEALRIPNGYFGLVPHQDFPSVQGSLNGAVVWLPLVKVDKDNYPLEVIPRSHLRGLASMVDHGSSTWEVEASWYDESHFVPAEVDVGDVIFMSMFTIHRSSKFGAPDRCRIAVSTRFDDANETSFIKRAYPSAYIRSVRREQYEENFPSIDLIGKTFGTS